jgi:hypothetical protein
MLVQRKPPVTTFEFLVAFELPAEANRQPSGRLRARLIDRALDLDIVRKPPPALH